MLTFAVMLLACSQDPNPAPSEPPVADPEPRAGLHVAVDFDDPSACAACHATVVDEWRTSMHARAHHDRDPIYGAMRDLRIEKQGAEMGAKCLVCHNPRSPEDADSPAGQQGVSCATCHAVEAVDSTKGPGAKALTFSAHTLTSARDVAPGASPVHGTGPAAPHLADGETMCLACHDATTTPTAEAACTTGPEYAEGEHGQTCVQCHMPRVDGASGSVSPRADHASHAFLGPHQAWKGEPGFLASAVEMTADLSAGQARITLVNQTGHAYPTGFPGRMAALVLRGFDRAGAEIWTSLGPEGVPTADALLNKVYVNADGQPVPAAFSQKLARDNRLKPGETRLISFVVPAEVTRVEAQLRFHLMPPKLAATLKLADAPEAKPQVVATVEANLP